MAAPAKRFRQVSRKFKYHWQAAFYTDLIGASGDWGPVENFVFVVVEKDRRTLSPSTNATTK